MAAPTAPKAVICPSMLSSDFANLAGEAQRMVDAGADWLHMDVMDGHFVPNLTLGAPVIASLRMHTRAYLDCHLMVSKPEQWVDDFAAAGADGFTFHIEATDDAAGLIQRVRAKGMRVGLTLKPGTPVEAVLPYASSVDLVLVMTVEPGFGGQKFMPSMMAKVAALRRAHPGLAIQVDGGLGPENIEVAAAAGANVIVAGTSIFKAPSPPSVIAQLRAAVDARAGQEPVLPA